MTLPVTLQQVKDHLRVDTDDSDNDLALKLASAQAAVLNYLKVDDLTALAAGDPATMPPRVDSAVSAATLLMVGYLYRERDNDATREWEMGYLPRPVMALLYSLRDPALA